VLKNVTQNEFIKYQIILTKFFFKKILKSWKTIFCVIMIIFPVFTAYHKLSFMLSNPSRYPTITQYDIDYLFFNSFVGFSILLFRLMYIIIFSDIVSGEFSNKFAMMLYSTPPSRKRILLSKVIAIILYSTALELLSFVIVGVGLLISTGLIVTLEVLLVGFLMVFLTFLFSFSISFMLSALTRNIIVSILIPILHFFFVEQFFIILDLENITYYYFVNMMNEVISNYLLTGAIILGIEEVSYLIGLISAPVIIFLITIFIFNKLDIRT